MFRCACSPKTLTARYNRWGKQYIGAEVIFNLNLGVRSGARATSWMCFHDLSLIVIISQLDEVDLYHRFYVVLLYIYLQSNRWLLFTLRHTHTQDISSCIDGILHLLVVILLVRLFELEVHHLISSPRIMNNQVNRAACAPQFTVSILKDMNDVAFIDDLFRTFTNQSPSISAVGRKRVWWCVFLLRSLTGFKQSHLQRHGTL